MTLIDQCVVSAGNFVTGLLLARGLPEHQFGAFSVVLETMLFLNSLQSALIVYPLTVRGATGSAAGLKRRTTAALILTLVLLPILGLAMGCGALAASVTRGNLWLAVTAISAMLLWQLQETVRRALLATFRGGECLVGDAVSYLGQALIIFFLYQQNRLTLPLVFATIGASSAVAAIIQALRVGPVKLTVVELIHSATEFWHLGRWALLSALMASVTALSYIWVLRFRGAEGPAVMAAISVPLKIGNPILLATGNLMVPAVARAFQNANHRKAFQAAVWYALPGTLTLLPFYAALIAFPGVALRLLLGKHSLYLNDAPFLRIYALNVAILFFDFVLQAYISGLGESRSNFLAQLFHAIAAACIAIPATALFGLQGLVIGVTVSSIISVIAGVIVLQRIVHRARRDREIAQFPRLAQPLPAAVH